MPLGSNHTDATAADIFIPPELTPPPVAGFAILLESGDFILLEQGSVDVLLKE